MINGQIIFCQHDLLKKFDMKVIFLCGSNPSFPFEKSLEDYKSYLQKTLEQKPLI